MKTLQHIILWLLLATLGASTAQAAANDIQISQRNPQNTAWVDRIFPTTNNSIIGTGTTGQPKIITLGGNLTQNGTTLDVTPGAFPDAATINGYFAEPSTNVSFSPVTWRGDLGLASSSTDNAIVRFDGLTGQTQNSGITITDSNVLTWATGNASISAPSSAIFASNVPFKIGTAVPQRYGTFTAAETVNAAKLDVNGYHAYEDFNQIAFDTGSPIFPAYASIDLRPVATGSILANHFVGLQSRPVYSGSGGISTYFDAVNTTAVHDGAGTIAGAAGLKINALGGTGPVTDNYGILIKAMTARANVTNAWPIYTEDGTVSFANAQVRGSTTLLGQTAFTGGVDDNTMLQNIALRWTSNGLIGGTNRGAIFGSTSGITIYGGSTPASHLNVSPLGVVSFSTPLAASSGGTGLSALGTGIATWLGTPSSANLAAAITDETGTAGSLVFSNAPTFTGTVGMASLTGTGTLTLNGAVDHTVRAGQAIFWYDSGNPASTLRGGIYSNASNGTVIFSGPSAVANRVTISPAGVVSLDNALGVSSGGTGQTSYTNGQLLIGDTTGNTLTKATLTAGPGVSVTNGSGSITLGQSGMSALRTGTATLVGGTVTVADAATAAATRIRLSMVTPGGTVGAQYISAKVNSTSFTITSTSASDTSVIYYEAFEP